MSVGTRTPLVPGRECVWDGPPRPKGSGSSVPVSTETTGHRRGTGTGSRGSVIGGRRVRCTGSEEVRGDVRHGPGVPVGTDVSDGFTT